MSSIRILVVEDEPIVAEDIASRLARLGYEIVGIAEAGEEAIAIATETLPSLVLMDIVLEGEIDGVEAAQQILNSLQIPVVYLTANADEVTLQRAKATIPFGYLLKPFKEKELQATIEIAISRHQTEMEVRRTLAEMQMGHPIVSPEFAELKAQYLIMAVHELRTPLSIVKISASLLRERGDTISESDRARNLNYIETAVSSMNELLEDVLTFSQINRPRIELNLESMNLKDFCENLIDSMRWSLGDQYILTFTAQGNCADVSLDAKLLWHLINNLLSNAVKYSPPGSTIALSVDCLDHVICLQLKDQGIGIPVDDHEKLFEPFHRARNVGSIAGTGLGLAIAKHCVDLHSGTISFESIPGIGTTFTVMLPRQTSSVAISA
jgi:hypothetical protein